MNVLKIFISISYLFCSFIAMFQVCIHVLHPPQDSGFLLLTSMRIFNYGKFSTNISLTIFSPILSLISFGNPHELYFGAFQFVLSQFLFHICCLSHWALFECFIFAALSSNLFLSLVTLAIYFSNLPAFLPSRIIKSVPYFSL